MVKIKKKNKAVLFTFNLVVVAFLYLFLLPQPVFSGNIIDTTDYAYWRKLAKTSKLYASMRASAIQTANHNDGKTRDVMGANALAYILNPSNKNKYVNAIKNKFETRIKTMKIGTGAATSSVPSHELFYAVLALDVIRYDLKPVIRSKYEGWLEEKIMKLVIGKWDPHAYAMRMLFYKYLGEETRFKEAKKEFDKGLSEHYMPNDGVSPAGNGYCVQRWNSIERAAKNTTLDILEYMGYNEYYNNPGLIGLHEFMYGYANAPFGRILIYGDSRNTETQKAWDIENDSIIVSPTIVSASRFSTEAYKYAMWILREGAGVTNGILKGHLSNYIIMAGSAAKNNPIEFNTDDAELAPSRLFKNYGALISKEQSTEALYLSLFNLTGNTEYHTHYEVNALAMAGYGETLLRNAGYDGPNVDVTVNGVTATFDFMHSNSESANTLMIGGKKHHSKVGDGIVEGFVGGNVEYFRGSSAKAVDGTHHRDVIFVQPSNGGNGYYLVMDHVNTQSAEDNVNVVWHPNAATLQTIKNKTAYFSEIKIEDGHTGPRLFSKNKVNLTTFLGTAPTSVDIKKTVKQSRVGYAFPSDYLYANYNTTNKQAHILTVLFPGDKNHKAGDLKQIKLGDYTGAEITQENIVDVALTSNGATKEQYDTATFKGENIVFRKVSGALQSFFVKGRFFKPEEASTIGFKSDVTVTLFLDTTTNEFKFKGQIISSGTQVTFFTTDVSKVMLNGKRIPISNTADNQISVNIPSGTFEIELL